MIIKILLLFSFFAVLGVLRQIWAQQQHLTDKDIKDLVQLKLRDREEAYHRIVSHLGICDKCQKKLEEFNKGKEIEEHLVD